MVRNTLKLLLAVLLFQLHFTVSTHAYSGEISKKIFEVGETITITALGLNQQGPYSSLCFSNDKNCFNFGSNIIKTWTDRKIEFVVPNIPISGSLTVYRQIKSEQCINISYSSYCYEIDDKEEFLKFDYKLKPSVYRINDEKKSLDDDKTLLFEKSGKIVYVEGIGFGEDIKSIEFGGVPAKILSWNNEEIKVEIPDGEFLNGITVVNFNNLSTTYEDFRVNTQISNDTLSYAQNYLRFANIIDFWKETKPKEEILVAVIDTGVYSNHSDLQGKIWNNSDEILGDSIDNDQNGYVDDKYGWNFLIGNNDISVLGSHGTTVAGIIAGNKNNSEGIAGIADKAKIMPLIACSNDIGCLPEAVSKSIYYAVDNGARIINMSLGGLKEISYSSEFDDPIKYAVDKGVVLVVAAGNGDLFSRGVDTTAFRLSPVCNESNKWWIIGVGASDKNNKNRTDWSNYGECADIYAQGEEIVSASLPATEDDFFYGIKDGTSFSAPIITGLISQVLSTYPEMSAKKVFEYLIASADSNVVNAKSFIDHIKKNYDPAKDDGIRWSNNEVSKDTVFLQDAKKSQYYESILSLKENGVISGYPDGTFRPFDPINRAEFLKIVVGASDPTVSYGGFCFKDVTNEWYASFACGAKNKGIINGYNDGSFKPLNNIILAEALKIIFNAFEIEVPKSKNNEEWYAPYVTYAKQNNLYLNTFNSASKNVTREEMAELINRIKKSKS